MKEVYGHIGKVSSDAVRDIKRWREPTVFVLTSGEGYFTDPGYVSLSVLLRPKGEEVKLDIVDANGTEYRGVKWESLGLLVVFEGASAQVDKDATVFQRMLPVEPKRN